MSDAPRRKLIEVALPLEAISAAAIEETAVPRRGHPSTLHIWWARRPLAACRAVLFASLVDDPSSRPDTYSEEQADAERARLFRLLEQLVKWESTTDERVLEQAREEIRRSTGGNPPPVLDPFCGRGVIPLEAQRLGLEAHASDINPVAVLITRALVEVPPRFDGCPPVNPEASERLELGAWSRSQGVAEDVRYYGRALRDGVAQRIGDLYPKAKLPDGHETTVIAWIWARTAKCPNPACGGEMPLVKSFALSTKKNRPVWVDPVVDKASRTVEFQIRTGHGNPPESPKVGRGANFRCLFCDEVALEDHIKREGMAGRLGTRLMAIVAEGERARTYLPPDRAHITAAQSAEALWRPDGEMPKTPRWFSPPLFGLANFADLFTDRQLVALTTVASSVATIHEHVTRDALAAGMADDGVSLGGGGAGARAYADAVSLCMAFVVSKLADWGSAVCTWMPSVEKVGHTFSKQAIPMTWDFCETNPLSHTVGNLLNHVEWVARSFETVPAGVPGRAAQRDATRAVNGVETAMICTDPPYYDNISYAELGDFFYVWLRRLLRDVYPDLFATVVTPKGPELVATPTRFGGSKDAARSHFEQGLRDAFARIREKHDPAIPMTLFYAFKQAEAEGDGLASTGWETMLEGLLGSGFMVTGTWPMRTERSARSVAIGTSALASSIVLVCRVRPEHAALATGREFTSTLRAELPEALRRLQSGSIAPVDLAQAAIGPGMAIFSRYSRVVEADGQPMRVRTALALINEALDELLAEQEADFDADTRWCVAWFEQHGMNEGPFGVAETLSRAKNTAINGLVEAGVLHSRGGKVRLLDRVELERTWDPAADTRLTIWEVTQHLIARHQTDGEEVAADLLRQVGGGLAEAARELAYRLFAICERKGWAQEALAYNSLVTAWPEITRLAAQAGDAGDAGEQEAMEM